MTWKELNLAHLDAIPDTQSDTLELTDRPPFLPQDFPA